MQQRMKILFWHKVLHTMVIDPVRRTKGFISYISLVSGSLPNSLSINLNPCRYYFPLLIPSNNDDDLNALGRWGAGPLAIMLHVQDQST